MPPFGMVPHVVNKYSYEFSPGRFLRNAGSYKWAASGSVNISDCYTSKGIERSPTFARLEVLLKVDLPSPDLCLGYWFAGGIEFFGGLTKSVDWGEGGRDNQGQRGGAEYHYPFAFGAQGCLSGLTTQSEPRGESPLRNPPSAAETKSHLAGSRRLSPSLIKKP